MTEKPTYEALEQQVLELEKADFDRKQADEALYRKTALLEAQLDSSIDGILVVDAQGKNILQNQRTVELWKIPQHIADNNDDETQVQHVMGMTKNPEQFVKKIAHLYKHPDESSRDEVELTDGTVFDRYSASLVGKDGQNFGRIWTFRDITERKKAEREIIQQKQKAERYLNLAGVMFIGLDIDGNINLANRKACEVLECDAADIIGQNWFDNFIPSNVRDNVRSVFNKLINGEIESVEYYENTIVSMNGKEKTIAWHNTDITGDDGKIIGTLGSGEDITDKRELESQLRQTQKMESMGTLAGGIAHDFNNILSPIMIHSEMAMMELPSGSPLQQNMKQIFEAGERARDLVKQILTFARRHEKERIPLKISRILKEAINLLRSTIPTTIDIQYHINSEQDTVLADPTQMNQIIINLCTNAAHSMEEKGGILEVTLTNENLDSESTNRFPGLEPGRNLKLTVRDTGQGIEPQFMGRIFEPYFTTKDIGKGTGMGLSIVHGIVKSYGGDVTVESEAGIGTSFHVYLPLVEGDEDILETVKELGQLPTGTERILFVDDEKGGIDAIQPMLEKLGYKVTARTSSIEALEAFRNNPQRFDLVITDMTMPNMTGKDLAKELMSIRPDVPIILCTGFSEKIDERRAEEMGIRAYVMKPIAMRQIANTIREVLDNKERSSQA
jgi:PAS domain S-box-containing protein